MIQKHAMPCDCAGTCGVAVVTSLEPYGDDPQEFYIEFYEAVSYANGFRGRARAALRVLRGKDPWVHDVTLTPAQLVGLRDFIDETVKEA